jgi:activator of HSP90 ATPase
MTKTIILERNFNAAPERLFDLYMDPVLHSTVTGGKAVVSRETGSSMSAWDGYIEGKMLAVEEGKLIVQTWRTSDWPDGADDSILIIRFEEGKSGGATVRLTNEGLPTEKAGEFEDGWKEFYLDKWESFL